MRVKWTERATKGKQQVANYIRRKFGDDRKDQFLQQVRETTQMLKQHPEMGSIDPLFEDFPITYRSTIINGLNKMVYYIEEDEKVIYIAALWDCRREPNKQREQTIARDEFAES